MRRVLWVAGAVVALAAVVIGWLFWPKHADIDRDVAAVAAQVSWNGGGTSSITGSGGNPDLGDEDAFFLARAVQILEAVPLPPGETPHQVKDDLMTQLVAAARGPRPPPASPRGATAERANSPAPVTEPVTPEAPRWLLDCCDWSLPLRM